MNTNILTSKYKIMNDKLIKNIELINNGINVLILNDVESKEYNSFGVHYEPNILFKFYESLNIFNFKLTFDYEISESDQIKIFDGKKWTIFNNYNTSYGTFNEILNFSFLKNYWRISTTHVQKNIKIINLNISIVNDEIFKSFQSKRSLLIIGGSLKMMKDFNENDNQLITTFGDNYLYNIKKYFIQKYNFNVYNVNISEIENNIFYLENINSFDYCIDVNQLGITNKGKIFYDVLKPKIKYGCYSLYDNYALFPGINSSKKSDDVLEDCIFCAVPDQNEIKVKHIGWASDDKIFFPNQDPNEKIILIDDCHYSDERNDSYNILDYCISLLQIYKNLKIIRFGFYDNVLNFNDKYKNKINNYTVIENKISITEKSKIHNKSWIFFCTHYETLGIPNIESAMSGSLLIYKKGFINNYLTSDLLKIEYNDVNDINKLEIFSKVDFDTQRKLAMNNTWEKLVDGIYINLK